MVNRRWWWWSVALFCERLLGVWRFRPIVLKQKEKKRKKCTRARTLERLCGAEHSLNPFFRFTIQLCHTCTTLRNSPMSVVFFFFIHNVPNGIFFRLLLGPPPPHPVSLSLLVVARWQCRRGPSALEGGDCCRKSRLWFYRLKTPGGRVCSNKARFSFIGGNREIGVWSGGRKVAGTCKLIYLPPQPVELGGGGVGGGEGGLGRGGGMKCLNYGLIKMKGEVSQSMHGLSPDCQNSFAVQVVAGCVCTRVGS